MKGMQAAMLGGSAMILLVLALRLLLKKHLPRAVSGILAHIYFALITVFGMAIFSSESNVFASLGRLLGIGVYGFSNVFTEAVLREYLYLIIAALLLSLPMIPALRRLIYRRFARMAQSRCRHAVRNSDRGGIERLPCRQYV